MICYFIIRYFRAIEMVKTSFTITNNGHMYCMFQSERVHSVKCLLCDSTLLLSIIGFGFVFFAGFHLL